MSMRRSHMQLIALIIRCGIKRSGASFSTQATVAGTLISASTSITPTSRGLRQIQTSSGGGSGSKSLIAKPAGLIGLRRRQPGRTTLRLEGQLIGQGVYTGSMSKPAALILSEGLAPLVLAKAKLILLAKAQLIKEHLRRNHRLIRWHPQLERSYLLIKFYQQLLLTKQRMQALRLITHHLQRSHLLMQGQAHLLVVIRLIKGRHHELMWTARPSPLEEPPRGTRR